MWGWGWRRGTRPNGAVGHPQGEEEAPSSAESPGLQSQLCHLFRHDTGEINPSETQFPCLKGGGEKSTFTGVNETRT